MTKKKSVLITLKRLFASSFLTFYDYILVTKNSPRVFSFSAFLSRLQLKSTVMCLCFKQKKPMYIMGSITSYKMTDGFATVRYQ